MHSLYKKLGTIVGNLTESGKNIISLDKNSGIPALINGINQTIFQINNLGQWIYLNAEWEKLTGFPVTETLGTDVIHHVHPDDKKQCAEFIQSIYNNASLSSSRRIRFLTRDAHLCWVNMRANSFTNPVNNQTCLVGVISDITERVREYGLHQANYRTLHTLLNNLCGLVYRGRNDRDWTMEYVSEGSFELTGYHPSELINQTVTFGSLIKPNDQELVWTNVQSALRENREYDINYRIRTSNGQEKWVWERGKGNFSSNGELLGIEGLIVDITDYKRNRLRENEEVLYRTRTTLPQKHLFLDRLSMAIAKTKLVDNYSFALLFIYIDRFKNLQDRFSAEIIDQIIIDVSEKINGIVNPADSLCLFGDGEFGLLLEHTESIHAVRTVTKNIRNVLLAPIKINDADTFLTISIGISLSSDNIKDRKSVIKEAYTALNQAKSLGGSRFEIHGTATNAKVYALDRMEKEIRYALKNNELLLCYHPLISREDNLANHYECRLYWNHPRRGKISSDFFSLLNTCDEIVNRLNIWIIESIIKQAKTLESQADFEKNLNLTIQFFGENIFTEKFLLKIEQQLLNIKFNNIKFSINISVNNIHTLSKNSIEILDRFHNQGIDLTMNTDASILPSSEDLFALAINTIKIDSACLTASVAMPRLTQKAAMAQIGYIHALGGKVIISDINTKERLDSMKEFDCDYLMGDSVSLPVNIDEI